MVGFVKINRKGNKFSINWKNIHLSLKAKEQSFFVNQQTIIERRIFDDSNKIQFALIYFFIDESIILSKIGRILKYY